MTITAPQQLKDLDGLMPYRAVTHEQRIEFIQPPDDLDFDRPFWHNTMTELEAADTAGDLEKVSVTFDELNRITTGIRPATTGMIFHVGRCGSTLISRMVGHDRSRLVLRESGVIGALHRESGGSALVPTFTVERAMHAALVAFDRFAASRNQRVVIKHSSWESFSMGRHSELLDGTPMVFVYRNPIETVESSLDGHPGWAGRIHQPRALLQRWVPWLDRIEQPFNAIDIYASVWAAGADAALRVDPERVLLVDHATVTAEPRRVLDALERHLKLDLDIDAALGELGHYSKAPVDGQRFEPEGRHRHPPLSTRSRDQLARVVGDLPAQLAERAAQQGL